MSDGHTEAWRMSDEEAKRRVLEEFARLRALYDAARDECEATRRAYVGCNASFNMMRERSHHDAVRKQHGLEPFNGRKFPENIAGGH